MKSLRHASIFWIAFYVGFLCAMASADPVPEVRPDLYIDGEALANHMTGYLLRNTYPGAALRRKTVFGMRSTLYHGAEFHENDPNRSALLKWMLAQPDASIHLHELLAKAVDLTNHSVQQGLILCWDVLREDYFNGEDRNAYKHILKLKDITGELELFDGQAHPWPKNAATNTEDKSQFNRKRRIPSRQSIPQLKTIRGDNFSAWYHFFGTALSAFHRTASRIYPISGKLETEFMIFMEERVLHDDHIDSRKRIAIDRAGAVFGEKLARNLRKYSTATEFDRSPEAASMEYLYDNPALYGPSWRLRKGQHPRDYRSNRRTKSREGLIARIRKAKPLLEPPNGFSLELAREVLSDAHPAVREFAITALAERTDQDSRDLLTKAITAPHPENSMAAAMKALAMRRDHEAIMLFWSLGIDSQDERLRNAASDVLSDLRDTPATRALVRDLWDRGKAHHTKRLLQALKGFDPQWRVEFLTQALKAHEPEVYEDAVAILSEAKDQWSLEVIEKCLQEEKIPDMSWKRFWAAYFGDSNNPDWQAIVRYNQTKLFLVHALATRDDKNAKVILQKMLIDADPRVRLAAADALRSDLAIKARRSFQRPQSYDLVRAQKNPCLLNALKRELLRATLNDPTREIRSSTIVFAVPLAFSFGLWGMIDFLEKKTHERLYESPLNSQNGLGIFQRNWPTLWKKLRIAHESKLDQKIAAWALSHNVKEEELPWNLPKGSLKDPKGISHNSKLAEAYFKELFAKSVEAHPNWTVRQWESETMNSLAK